MSGVAKLALEDGSVWTGQSFGARGERTGEVVFHTAMAGYQEVLTDPSYCGQIVVMTAVHIGNYGVNETDVESRRPWVEGFAAREFSEVTSNPRATGSLRDYMVRHGIVGVDRLDTRAITRRLRTTGSLNGVVSTEDLNDASLLCKARAVPKMVGRDLVREVVLERPAHWTELLGLPRDRAPSARARVVVVDCGVKYTIVRRLVEEGCDVTVVPATWPAEELLAADPDGVVFSNGPGDPEPLSYVIALAREVLERGIPAFGICLGHQVLGLALGARTYKLKFGHHGANHPVRNVLTGRVEITSQNHGFSVEAEGLRAAGAQITHVNLNDGTVEGFCHPRRRVMAVQYHPEAAPGPHDSRYLFAEFLRAVGAGWQGANDE